MSTTSSLVTRLAATSELEQVTANSNMGTKKTKKSINKESNPSSSVPKSLPKEQRSVFDRSRFDIIDLRHKSHVDLLHRLQQRNALYPFLFEHKKDTAGTRHRIQSCPHLGGLQPEFSKELKSLSIVKTSLLQQCSLFRDLHDVSSLCSHEERIHFSYP